MSEHRSERQGPVVRLRMADTARALGRDRSPRWSWAIDDPAFTPTARRLVVATRADRLDTPDVWDSGWVAHDEQTGIVAGHGVLAHRAYVTAVQVRGGDRTEVSPPMHWETGAITEADWAGARWIAASVHLDGAAVLTQTFSLDHTPVRTRLHWTGLGFGRALVNGITVDDAVQEPGYTAYHRRVLTLSHDVTELLRAGENELSIEVTPGWFGLRPDRTIFWHKAPWLGAPRARALLRAEAADGSITTFVSDETWTWRQGSATSESVYAGESHDLRVGTESAPVSLVAAPDGALEPASAPPVRPIGRENPVRRWEDDGRTFAEFPTAAGWVELSGEVRAGREVVVRYGERLTADGSVDVGGDPGLTVGDVQIDRLIPAHDGALTWSPSWTYKGYRFVEITGMTVDPDGLTSVLVHNDVADVAELECSDPILQRLWEMTRRSLRNNFHNIIEDTPLFEKRGWTGDAQLTVETALFQMDVAPLYTQWLRDVVDSQDERGNPGDLAPTSQAGDSNDVTWSSALLIVPWEVYRHTGDRSVLQEFQPAIADFLAFLHRCAASQELPALYGDWVPAGQHEPWPPEGADLCSHAHAVRCFDLAVQMARVLGDEDGAGRAAASAAEFRAEFRRRYWDGGTGTFRTPGRGGLRQTSQLLPLTFGLCAPEERASLVETVVRDIHEHDDHLGVGVVGARYLPQLLSRNGHADLAHRIVTRPDAPSWGHWVAEGAATLWEQWTEPRSQDHHMFGSVAGWIATDVAGLRPTAPGWRTFDVAPHPPRGVESCALRLQTPRGVAAVRWQTTGTTVELDVDVPSGSKARLRLPTGAATLGPGHHRASFTRAASAPAGSRRPAQ